MQIELEEWPRVPARMHMGPPPSNTDAGEREVRDGPGTRTVLVPPHPEKSPEGSRASTPGPGLGLAGCYEAPSLKVRT